jgi:ferredoxin
VSEPREERVLAGLRVRIDRSLCVGFGDCVGIAPEAFALDDENVAVLVDPDRVDRARFIEACDACPVDAITVWEEDGRQIVP